MGVLRLLCRPYLAPGHGWGLRWVSGVGPCVLGRGGRGGVRRRAVCAQGGTATEGDLGG